MKKTEADMKRQERAGTRGIPADYPLQTCLISGEKLGAHGDPIKVTHAEMDIWLCCKSYIDDINKDPARYVKQAKDAMK